MNTKSKLNLYRIRGGDEVSLKNKKYNIGVGISLGNKWFTLENIVELVQWSLSYTKDVVIVYVADSIHAINLEIRMDISKEKAQKVADTMGTDILDKVKSELEKVLSPENFKKIKYVKWNEIIDSAYDEKLRYLYLSYNSDSVFKNTIYEIVKDFTSKEARKFNEQQMNRFGDYLIEEFPELLNRVKMAGTRCDAYICPFDSKMTQLVESIQNGEIFPEIKEKIMDTEPKVFLEVR